MKEDEKYEDIEFALQLICHPERVDEREAEAWLREEANRKLIKKLRCYREAGFPGCGIGRVDVDRAWSMFHEKHAGTRRKFRLGWIVSVSAAVVVVCMFTFIFFNSDNNRGRIKSVGLTHASMPEVTIITADGERKVLERGLLQLDEKAREECVYTDSVRGMSYLNVRGDSSLWKSYHTLCVPRGAEYFLQLEDGSKVWLNSDTELRYPVAFGDESREVELLRGEAYFEVNREEGRPFVVKAECMTTRVLGTEFNVRSYVGKQMSVTLVKGSVSVRGNEAGSEEVVLKPGENASLVDDKLVVEEVEVMKYVAWKDGFFYYNNVRLEEILDELGRWFDFPVFYQNQAVKDYRFKFWANRREMPEQVIERLNNTGKLKVEWNNGNVVVSE